MPQTKERHKAYMENWRRQKKVKECQRVEFPNAPNVYDCLTFRKIIRGEAKREDYPDFSCSSHFSNCKSCAFWFREMKASEKKDSKEDSSLWRGVCLWDNKETPDESTESEKERRDRENQNAFRKEFGDRTE